MLLNANAECFITGTNYQGNVPVSAISHGLNAMEIGSDNLQVSYDSVLRECPLVHDILTPDLTGLVHHYEHLEMRNMLWEKLYILL